jgi:hypothetical protein
MSFKFNSGYGAVVCDCCGIMFDSGLGPDDYNKIYGGPKTPDRCWRHKDSLLPHEYFLDNDLPVPPECEHITRHQYREVAERQGSGLQNRV